MGNATWGVQQSAPVDNDTTTLNKTYHDATPLVLPAESVTQLLPHIDFQIPQGGAVISVYATVRFTVPGEEVEAGVEVKILIDGEEIAQIANPVKALEDLWVYTNGTERAQNPIAIAEGTDPKVEPTPFWIYLEPGPHQIEFIAEGEEKEPHAVALERTLSVKV